MGEGIPSPKMVLRRAMLIPDARHYRTEFKALAAGAMGAKEAPRE